MVLKQLAIHVQKNNPELRLAKLNKNLTQNGS